jgi:ABC-type transport system involved in multi-copper enzyme maturation permease subunit
MTRIIRAELRRLVRPRPVAAMALGALAFSLVAALTVFPSALSSGGPSARGGTTVQALSGPGGATEAFAVAMSFVGFLVFVTFIALVATEFSGGTFRALLLRHPHRLRLITGKLIATLLVTAGAVALAELLTAVLSVAVAPGNEVPTGAWFSTAGLGHAVGNYLTALGGVTGWAVFGTTLAVVFRSAPVALGVGFAWAGPFENIVSESWATGYRIFPGQVLGSVIRGGTMELAMSRAVLTALLYTAMAGIVMVTLVARRDVTA